MKLPPETLQRLIDFAHAAMEKRPGVDDAFPVTQSRRPSGYACLLAKDLREIQKLGKPSWANLVEQLKANFGWHESDIEHGAAGFKSNGNWACITEDSGEYNVCVYSDATGEVIGYMLNVDSAKQVHEDFIAGRWQS